MKMGFPKLNVRDWFWLVAVIAVGVTWRLDHRQLREGLAWLKVKETAMPATDGGPIVIDGRSGERKVFE
jgi:hypothetical protein